MYIPQKQRYYRPNVPTVVLVNLKYQVPDELEVRSWRNLAVL